MKSLFIIGIILGLLSCSSSEEKTSSQYDFEYDCEIRKYYNDTLDWRNLRHIEFYNSAKKLLRVIGTEEGCTRYFYNEKGKLKEQIWGRNCLGDRREIMIYDKSDNLLGTYITKDSLINIDTVSFKQKYFYDSNNRLIKTLEREWSNNGEKFEEWNYYSYEHDRIRTVITKQNEGLLWNTTYEYNDSSQLIGIHRVRNHIKENEFFKYNNKGLLIEERVENNEYKLTPEVSHSARNQKTIYKYDSLGRLIEEVILSHKNKVQVKTIYVIKKKI